MLGKTIIYIVFNGCVPILNLGYLLTDWNFRLE